MRKNFFILLAIIIVVGIALIAFAQNQWASPNPPLQTTTQSPKSVKTTKLLAVGDLVCAPGTQVTPVTCQAQAVTDAITKNGSDAVLLLGDLQYERGAISAFQEAFAPIWADLNPKTYAVPGDREYGTAKAAGYFEYWNGDKKQSRQAGETGKGYYSFDTNGWHIIALNSNCESVGCGPASEQLAWLKQDLDESTAACTLAFWHHPVFTSGQFTDDAKSRAYGQDFWPVLERAKADVVLNAHDHIYERFAVQTINGVEDPEGIRQFTVGTGGRSLYKTKPARLSTSQKVIDNTFGFLELTLKANKQYIWKFINTEGETLDTGTSRCVV